MTASLPVSRYLRDLPPYPFSHLDTLREEVEARGVRVIDLGMGDPREPTPEPVRKALASAIPETSPYPRILGVPELREAIAAWFRRRFGIAIDPGRELLPTLGSKEAIFTLPLAVLDARERPLVLVPDPGYPVYELGTRAAGGEVHWLPLAGANGFLPDLAAIPEEVWKRASILWINYPNNPTGAVAPREFFAEAAARCREHGVLLVSDEAYTEIYFGDPPPTALAEGTENLLVLHTLSKRSGMAGFRSGFLAGDPRLVEGLKRFRPAVGVAAPQFVQAAARAAWSDEVHVEAIRRRFRERRDAVVPALRRLGFSVPDVEATLYVWFPVPAGLRSQEFVERCLRVGVALLPGTAMGPAGEGYARLSLTAGVEDLREAVTRLGGISW